MTSFIQKLHPSHIPKRFKSEPEGKDLPGKNAIESTADGFDRQGELNDFWAQSQRGPRITVTPQKVFDKNTRFYAIGSCFALEIQRFLDVEGFDAFPKMLGFNLPGQQVLRKLPEESTLAYYTPMSILQEFELALDGKRYGPEDFFRIEKPKNAFARRLGADVVYQDPYRRDVYAPSLEALSDLSHQIRDGIEKADVYVITLGLTEGWVNKSNNLWVCKYPKRDDLTFRQISYSEAYSGVDKLVSRLAAAFPEKHVLLTVSPVPLGRTFRGRIS